jgi:hypothetical protein
MLSGPNGLSATAPAFALSNACFYAVAQATYSLSNNVNMIVGAQLPIGPREQRVRRHSARAEHAAVSGATAALLSPASRLFLEVHIDHCGMIARYAQSGPPQHRFIFLVIRSGALPLPMSTLLHHVA